MGLSACSGTAHLTASSFASTSSVSRAALEKGRNLFWRSSWTMSAVGLRQVLADDHLHESGLVRRFLELQLQFAREQVLSCVTKPVRSLPGILDAKE